jgi:hypothetical protein
MKLTDARNFSLLVNDGAAYEALKAYADHRIEVLMKAFLSAQSIEDVRALQKSIEELKRIKTLKEEISTATKE